jgi:hypothetical protein
VIKKMLYPPLRYPASYPIPSQTTAIPPMVNQAKQVAMNPRDQASASRWRDANDFLLDSVRGVGDAITGLPSRRATPQQAQQQQQQQQQPPQQRYAQQEHMNNFQVSFGISRGKKLCIVCIGGTN